MELNCTTCIKDLEAKLSELPSAWRRQIAQFLCKNIIETNSYLNCDKVQECESITILSEFEIQGSSACIKYKDENGVEVNRCFNFENILNASLDGVDPNCLMTQEEWNTATITERWQAIVDRVCESCTEPPLTTVGPPTTTSTLSAPPPISPCTEYLITNNSDTNKKVFLQYCGDTGLDAVDLPQGQQLTVCAATGTVSVQDCPTCTIVEQGVCSDVTTTLAPTTTVAPPELVWVEDTKFCEQDALFTLIDEIDGFSSPGALYYDIVTERYYVGDHDNSTGNVYKFNPIGFNNVGQVTPISGFNDIAYAIKVDSQYRRIYFVGQDTGGLVVFDIASETFSTVPYGTDGSPFNRVNINIVGDRIYVQDRGDGTMTIINRINLSIISSMPVSSIPSGATYFDDYNMTAVGSEVWITASYNSTPNIARYDVGLTTLIGTISLTALGATPEGAKYRGSTYYDVDNGIVYVADAGSKKLFIFNSSGILQDTIDFLNTQGKAYMLPSFVEDPITHDLLMNLSGYNSPGDVAKTSRIYNVDRLTYDLLMLYPSQTFGNLVQQGSANILFGTASGVTQWEGGPWATDGKINKYSR